MTHHTPTAPESVPEPTNGLPEDLANLSQRVTPLRDFLGAYDPTGRLSTLLLVAVLSRMNDVIAVIGAGKNGPDLFAWGPLDDLPQCVRTAGGDDLNPVMLILLSDIASSFTKGFEPPDTQIAALAMELVLEESRFLAETWEIGITAQEIADLRDPLFHDTDHLLLRNSKRKLGRKQYRALFDSFFGRPDGSNGLHPFVKTP